MKALSVRPDYAAEILAGYKTKEYRTWKTDYRGPVVICSTAKKIPNTIPGHALCVVNLTDIHELAPGQYAWDIELADQMLLPFPTKGKRKLFDLNDDLINYFDEDDYETQEEIDVAVANILKPLVYKPEFF